MSGMFPFNFEPPTEEELAEMKRQHEIEHMRQDEFRHGFQRLFEELDETQLSSLKTMMHWIVASQSPLLAATWEGMAAHALKARFNICITCGVDHDKEAPVPEEKKTDSVQNIVDAVNATWIDVPEP